MNLQFITAATSQTGRGHVYRTIALAQEMKKRKHEVHIVTTSNTVGEKVVRALAPNLQDAFLYGSVDYYVLDIPGPHHYVPHAESTVYLDWAGDEAYDGAGVRDCVLKVCQGVPFRETNTNDVLTGFEYAILWPDVVEYRGWERRKQIFFYSSQRNELTDKVLGLLQSTGIEIVQPQPTGCKRATEELAASAIAVTFGGMTCLEACCLGIPQVAISTGPKHELQIRELDAYDAVWDVSSQRLDLMLDAVCAILDSWQQTGQIYANMSKAGMRCVDGKGVYRVADIIEQLALSVEKNEFSAYLAKE